MNIYQRLLKTIDVKGAAYLILIDPDRIELKELPVFAKKCEHSGVDGFLVGGSLMHNGDFNSFLITLKNSTHLPVIIFPGDVNQVNKNADALLYLSVISGRNPEHLIGKHVIAAPLIKRAGIEPISTGYILVESGTITTAQYMSGSSPVPRNKPEIAAATALAGEYFGYKFIYLEAGSGAQNSVPAEMIKAVSQTCSIPVICGGGIRTPQEARDKVDAGAKVIVTGNYFEDESKWDLIKYFAGAIHYKQTVEV